MLEHFSNADNLTAVARLSESEEHWIKREAHMEEPALVFQAVQFIMSTNPSHPVLSQMCRSLTDSLDEGNEAIRQYLALAAGYSLKAVGEHEEAAECFHYILILLRA